MQIPEKINKISYKIIGACMKVHTGLGPGFPEEYYQKALEYEFNQQEILFEPQKQVAVFYEEMQVGLNYLDFVVEDCVILEIKSVKHLDDVHKAQVIRYLAGTDHTLALLINFGNSSLDYKRILPPRKIQEFKSK